MVFAPVMATGIASQLAGLGALSSLSTPLFYLAQLIAAGILARRLFRILAPRARDHLHWLKKIDSAQATGNHDGGTDQASSQREGVMSIRRLFVASHAGSQTVPIGFAVIALGLAERGELIAAKAMVALALAAMVWLDCPRCLVAASSLARRALRSHLETDRSGGGLRIASVEGSWFLVPACPLAIAAAFSATLSASQKSTFQPSWFISDVLFGLVAAGLVGYALTLVLSAIRLFSVGLGGSLHTPWWIAAGCGGLAAASVGRANLAISPGRDSPAMAWAALLAWSMASVLILPVLARNAVMIMRRSPPWPPTFSTGVYALGGYQVARMWKLAAIGEVAHVAGWLTVALWMLTSAVLAWLWMAMRTRHLS